MAHPDVEDLKAALVEDWPKRVRPWANLLDEHQKCLAANLHVLLRAWKRGARGQENGQLILKYAREVWEACPILLDRCGSEVRDPDLILVLLALYEAEAEGELESVIVDGQEMFRAASSMHPGWWYTWEKKKCRCEACRTWNRNRQRELQVVRRSRPPPDRVHGTIGGYNNWSCRCPRCALAHSRAMKTRYDPEPQYHTQKNSITAEEARAEMRVAA
jgi:hypothetical protein